METENTIAKIKRFARGHKKVLLTGTTVAGGIVLMTLGCKHLPKKSVPNLSSIFKSNIEDISIPDELKVWNTRELWYEGESLKAVIQNIPMDDLGELGDRFVGSGLADPSDMVSIVLEAGMR